MEWLQWVHGTVSPTAASAVRPGDEVRVWFKILEQGKERLGQFEGTVIRARGAGSSKTFTIRRVTYGEGVERVFPVDSKTLTKIERLRTGRVKRSRLYFLRTVVGKTRLASVKVSTSAGTSGQSTPATSQPAHPRPAPESAQPAPRVEMAVEPSAEPPTARTASA